MEHENISYGQAQAKPSYSGSALGAEVIREASLRNKADETDGYLKHAHALMDDLETALSGPQPRPMSGSSKDDPAPGHPGLRHVLSINSERAATLVSRLSTLIGSL